MQIKDIMKIDDYKKQIEELQKANAELVHKLDALEGENYFSIQGKVNQLNSCYDQRLHESRTLSSQIREQFEKNKELDKQISHKQKTLLRMNELYESMVYSIDNFINIPLEYEDCKLSEKYISEYERLTPVVHLNLKDMDNNSLNKLFSEKEILIEDLFKQYVTNYETPANRAVFELMTISIKSEMQNILYNIDTFQLEEGLEMVKKICQKILKITCETNTSLAGSYTKIIGELEFHYSELIHIRHEAIKKQDN